MKKKLYILLAVLALVAGSGLEAFRVVPRGGRHRGGRVVRHRGHGGGWGHRRHRGWGWGGGPAFGVGLSFGGPGYYEPAPVAYLDDPYDWYWTRNPRASWDAYVRWLELNSSRFRRPWGYYHGSRFRRRWRRRPGFGVSFGFGF